MPRPAPPHLTPASLVGTRFGRGTFAGIRVALVGYCPPPKVLARYAPERVSDQHFIHLSPDSVRIVAWGGARFLSLAHVYGGPVSASTVEELAYYGIEWILAYGLAGGLGTEGPGMGDFYVVRDAFAADGTTPHYSRDRLVEADAGLLALTTSAWSSCPSAPALLPVRAATGDAIYREHDEMLDGFRGSGCGIVNLDSAHLYAASRSNAEGRTMKTVQCGVVSDVAAAGVDSRSTLATMLAGGGEGLNPLERTGEIVSFYVETLAPRLG